MTKWFVVADEYRSQPDDPENCVWTLSRNPDEIGWETDSGFPGYGLLKKDAEELAGAANRIEKLEAALRQIEHENTFPSRLAEELGHKCGPFATIARKALEDKQ